jgi:chromosome partitioning protein
MTHDEAKKNNKKYDVILVDTPPYLSEKIPTIFSEADFVLIPTKAGVPDVMAIDATIKLFKEAQKNNNKLLGGIILNMVKPRTSLTFFAKEQLYAYNIPILGQIGDRVAFNNTFLSGGIFTSEDSQAKQEIELLATEILNVLK